MKRANGSLPNNAPSNGSRPEAPSSDDRAPTSPTPNRTPSDASLLIQFFGRWFRGEKRAVRTAVEAVEPTLRLGPPSDAFFPARWHAAVQIRRLGQEPPHRQFTAYRAGHGRVLSALDLDDLCAQIRALRTPSLEDRHHDTSPRGNTPRNKNRRTGDAPSGGAHA